VSLTSFLPNIVDLSREDFLNHLALDIEVEHLVAAPRRYAGQVIPVNFDAEGEVLAKEVVGYEEWRSIPMGDVRLEVGLLSAYDGVVGPVYAEIVFLGKKQNAEGVYLAVAKGLHSLPKDRRYPALPSDEIALSMVVDEMENPTLHAMTRGVSAQVVSHFFAKMNDAEALAEPADVVRYTDLMETPNRYRGEKVKFTGTLIFKKRNRMTSLGLPPGMDVVEEGYLLNSDRVLFLFRTPKIPREIKVNDIVSLEGYFLQRINFLNRMNRATWAPLILASELKRVEEPSYGMTETESVGVTGLLSVLGVVGLWLLVRKKAPVGAKRLKNNKMTPRKKEE
jgi:hypothetical protein